MRSRPPSAPLLPRLRASSLPLCVSSLSFLRLVSPSLRSVTPSCASPLPPAPRLSPLSRSVLSTERCGLRCFQAVLVAHRILVRWLPNSPSLIPDDSLSTVRTESYSKRVLNDVPRETPTRSRYTTGRDSSYPSSPVVPLPLSPFSDFGARSTCTAVFRSVGTRPPLTIYTVYCDIES